MRTALVLLALSASQAPAAPFCGKMLSFAGQLVRAATAAPSVERLAALGNTTPAKVRELLGDRQIPRWVASSVVVTVAAAGIYSVTLHFRELGMRNWATLHSSNFLLTAMGTFGLSGMIHMVTGVESLASRKPHWITAKVRAAMSFLAGVAVNLVMEVADSDNHPGTKMDIPDLTAGVIGSATGATLEWWLDRWMRVRLEDELLAGKSPFPNEED